jgi:predicted DNA binding CopG/RHH family protein
MSLFHLTGNWPCSREKIRLDREEAELLDAYEAGEWRTIEGWEAEAERYQAYVRAAFKRNKRVNIRISSRDLDEIKKRAIEEGIPYRTLMASVLHRYESGRLVDRP